MHFFFSDLPQIISKALSSGNEANDLLKTITRLHLERKLQRDSQTSETYILSLISSS